MRRQARALKDAEDNLHIATAVILAFVRDPSTFEQRLMAPIRAERFRRESATAALAAEHAEAAHEYTILRSRAEASTAAAVAACVARYTATARAGGAARAACMAAAQRMHAAHARVARGFHTGSAAIVAARSLQAGIVSRVVRERKIHAHAACVTAAHAAEQLRRRDCAARRAAVERVQLCMALAARVRLRTDRRTNARRGVLAKKRCRAVPKAQLQVYQQGQGVFARARATSIASVGASSRAAAIAAANAAAAARARGQVTFAGVLADACNRATEAREAAPVQPSGDSGSERGSQSGVCSEGAGGDADALPSAAWLLGAAAAMDSASGDDAAGEAVDFPEVWPEALPVSPTGAGSGVSFANDGTDAAVGTARARSASAAPLGTIHHIVGSPRDGGGRPASAVTEQQVLQGVTFADVRMLRDGEDDGSGVPMAARRPWTSCAAATSLQRTVAEVQRSLRSSPGSAALRLWEQGLDDDAAQVSVRHSDRQVRNRNAPRASAADPGAQVGATEAEALPAVQQERLPAVHRVPVPTGVGALVEATRTMRAPAAAELSKRAALQRTQTLRRVSFGGALGATDFGAAAADEDAALQSLFRPTSARQHGRGRGGPPGTGRGGGA